MRVLSTGWSAYSIWRTRDIHTRFQVLITDGPCQVDLFPEYFKQRGAIQIADLALNVVALAASCYLVWHLVKVYATSMFKRVGAPEHIVKLYGVSPLNTGFLSDSEVHDSHSWECSSACNYLSMFLSHRRLCG